MNAARKFTLPMLVAICLTVSGATPAVGEVSTNGVKAATEPGRARPPIAKGELNQVDLLRRQIKLATQDGVRTFDYTDKTYIFRGKEKITADQLKPGEIIAVRFTTDKDGNAVLVRIKAQASEISTNKPANGGP